MELLLFPAWIVFAICVGALASSRGRSGGAWFFLALLISPLIAAVLVMVMSDLKAEELALRERTREFERQEQQRKQATKQQEEQQRLARRDAAKITGPDLCLSIEKLRQLREKSVLSEIEFAARKAKVLLDLRQRWIVEPPEEFLAALLPLLDNGALTQDEMAKVKEIAFADVSQVPPSDPPVNLLAVMDEIEAGVPCPECGSPVPVDATRCSKCWASFPSAKSLVRVG